MGCPQLGTYDCRETHASRCYASNHGRFSSIFLSYFYVVGFNLTV